MDKLSCVCLALFLLITTAVQGQELSDPSIQDFIKKKFSEDGVYLGNPGLSDGLRFIKMLPNNQIVIWGFGNFCLKNDKLILPINKCTGNFIDLSDPNLIVTIKEHRGILLDSCLVIPNHSKKITEETHVLWVMEGKAKP